MIVKTSTKKQIAKKEQNNIVDQLYGAQQDLTRLINVANAATDQITLQKLIQAVAEHIADMQRIQGIISTTPSNKS